MKKITIKSLELLNFKGAKKQKVDFKQKTTIAGANGTGKTTVFDAITWLLFGKDSQDRKTFDIKTLDSDGKAIAKLPHEVSAVMDVDGKEVRLSRRYTEKWTKKRGESEETFTGHEEARLWNDVPMSVKEWNSKIEDLCPEDIFKFVTNPAYFTSQKMEVQRALLFSMAGGVSDDEIKASNKDFESLVDLLQEKTIEELKKELSAKKKRVKAESDGYPARIDELQRMIAQYGDLDVDNAEKEIERLNAEIAKIDAENGNAQRLIMAEASKHQGTSDKIKELTLLMSNREKSLIEETLRAWKDESNKRNLVLASIAEKEASIEKNKALHESAQTACNNYALILEELRGEWHEINSRQLVLSPDEFVCPTCHRPLDVEGIEAKQREMTEAFNLSKAQLLEQNSAKGQYTKTKWEEAKANVADYLYLIESGTKEIESLKASTPAEIPMPDTTGLAEKDEEWNKLKTERDELESKLSATSSDSNSSVVANNAKREDLQNLISTQRGIIEKSKEVEKLDERIAQLVEAAKKSAQDLADVEKQEFTLSAFLKAKVSAAEGKINSMFPTVRFKLFEEQINGGEKECCEATVNGVPYSSLNHAGQVLAGLEIIDAICEFNGVRAPIVIDNSESINVIPKSESQTILLRVTDEKKLNVSYDE